MNKMYDKPEDAMGKLERLLNKYLAPKLNGVWNEEAISKAKNDLTDTIMINIVNMNFIVDDVNNTFKILSGESIGGAAVIDIRLTLPLDTISCAIDGVCKTVEAKHIPGLDNFYIDIKAMYKDEAIQIASMDYSHHLNGFRNIRYTKYFVINVVPKFTIRNAIPYIKYRALFILKKLIGKIR